MIRYTGEQQRAIDTLSSNLQIIACAGSGKTQVIAERIANILSSNPNVGPKNIIAFTYTEKAAAELKTRVLNLCKKRLPDLKGLAEMYIGTIHSWCLQALQDNIYEYQKFSVLDEIKLKLFVDKYYNDIGMPELDLKRYEDTSRFITVLSVLREAELEQGQHLPNEWVTAQAKYEAILKKHAYFDFSMILTEAIQNLKHNPRFRHFIDTTLKYLIVDEYQDVNPIEEELIRELSVSGCNLCVVGDDDQTIYQWRGGDVNYIQHFSSRYPNVTSIRLEDNFRSSKGIVDCALASIHHNIQRLSKVMKAEGHQSFALGDILYNQYDDVESEAAFVVETIKKLHGTAFQDKRDASPRGLAYSDFAILLRKWRKAKDFMEALAANGIPFVVAGINELFQTAEVKAARAIYQFLHNELDEEALLWYWLAVSDQIKEEPLRKAIKELEKKKPSPSMYFATFNIQEIFWAFLESAEIREEVLEDVNLPDKVGNKVHELIFYNLGMFSQIINDFEIIHFKDTPAFKLNRFLHFLTSSAEEYYPEGWLNNTYTTPNAVQIMTIFQSKGLEFPAVFIPGLNKNYLPTARPRGYFAVTNNIIQALPVKNVGRYIANTEDERRLMYVAITRSMNYLFITRAPEFNDQGQLKKDFQKESEFAREVSTSDYIISDKNPDYSLKPRLNPQPRQEHSPILLNFSVLKAYFDCPYRFKLISVYGFNSPLSERIGYGTSLHHILMELHRKYLEGIDIKQENIEDIVDKHLHLPYAPANALATIKSSALSVTRDYLRDNYTDFSRIEYAEKEIQLDLGDGIMVNGRMDLIKKKELDGRELTTIIDFKSQKDAQAQDMTMDQLALYALGYYDLTGKRADLLQIYNLDEDKSSKQTQRLENDQIAGIRDKIVGAATAIKANQLEKTLDIKVCSSCYYQTLCSGPKTKDYGKAI